MRLDRLAAAAELERTGGLGLDLAANQPVGLIADHDAAGGRP